MAEDEAQVSPPDSLLQLIDNLARFHREHEKYYAQAPLRQAGDLQARSRALKALADRWSVIGVGEHASEIAFAGTEDLNAPGLVAESGILFMEGEGEPAELQRLKREVGLLADDLEQTGVWLAEAMEQAWEMAGGPGCLSRAGRPARGAAPDHCRRLAVGGSADTDRAAAATRP
ncbi:hypothetical protein [Streptomyces nymphaeiformis]|uniref:Uncharacterized protein n=1 Tax=Streptomyces nymphaeiformis TaxID=2663842 RepID=A0A7W7U627_9ACTN|nr:hypothetical protein [Streptomyces nymphaeiformis]MBB4984270.1 hypothetical protein [Streptomyces nymphaeiformis]